MVRRFASSPAIAELGEMMVMNYRVARLDSRQRGMLDFAWKLTTEPHMVIDTDREALAALGLSSADIFDLAETVGFYNMSNRVAIATDLMPNKAYHAKDR